MKKRYITGLLLPVISVLLAVCNTSKKEQKKEHPPTVSRFSWLVGAWEMKEKHGVVTEDWKQVNDSLMEGRSDFIKGDSVIPFETIRMYRQDTAFYYEAKAAGQNEEKPVAFRLTTISDSGFVAENPQHDFPRRISYTLVNKDSVHAYVDGGPSAPGKRSDFHYSRKKN